MGVLAFLGSVAFTVVLSAVLIILFIVSTSLEAMHGTTFAQRFFYQTGWFEGLLALLAVNIACATLLRFPFKKHHTGFVLTHIGIIGLLIGSFLTSRFGLEGQMTVEEGAVNSRVVTGGYELAVNLPGRDKAIYALKAGTQSVPLTLEGISVTAQLLENAAQKFVVSEGAAGMFSNRALKVSLKGAGSGPVRTAWLIEKNPLDPHGNMFFDNSVNFFLDQQPQKNVKVTAPTLKIATKSGEELGPVVLKPGIASDFDLGKSGWRVTNLKFYEHARVVENKLADVPGTKVNPAAEFDLADPKGKKAHYLKFAYFPEFESMHARAKSDQLDAIVTFQAPQIEDPMNDEGAAVHFYPSENGAWGYTLQVPGQEPQEKSVVLNEWVNISGQNEAFRVEEAVQRAVIDTIFEKASSAAEGTPALEIRAQDGTELYQQWIHEGEKIGFRSSHGDLYFEFHSKQRELPFAVELQAFRRVDYPGTNNPASYESDVVIKDETDKMELKRTISMNRPLDYKGYRIFQSSYIQQASGGAASVFTVAKNPGISWIYLSSIVMFSGVFCQFYVKSLSRAPEKNKGQG